MIKHTIFILLSVLFFSAAAVAQTGAPASFYDYQNAVYAESVPQPDMDGLYEKAAADLRAASYPEEKRAALAGALEEARARQFLLADNKAAALVVVEKALADLEKALDKNPDAEGYAALAGLYSQGTKAKPGSTISMGLKIQGATKKAVKMDETNPTAGHLLASGSVYAPAAFRNLKKGIALAQDYLEKGASKATKADIFNLTICIAHGYYLLEDQQNAAIWFDKAARLFPDARVVRERGWM